MVVADYFDFWNILRNELIGSTIMFIVIGIILIIIISKIKNLFSQTTIMLVGLWLCVIFIKTQLMILWLLTVLCCGLVFAQGISTTLKR